jgi:peptide/nickel transport system substrate-binding protein
MKTKIAIGVAVASSMLLIGAGMGVVGATNVRPAAAMGKTTLVIGDQDGSPGYTENFNPLSVNALNGVMFMYEPMYEVDEVTGKQTPWLASSYKWIGNTEVQFTIRNGVKWSNGQPFTAQDVVFTFDLLKKYKALDVNGVWSYLKSVSASGNVVSFVFTQPNVPGWQYIAQQQIVYPPQFQNVNPVTFTDTAPIVTGPYVLSKFNPSQYTMTVNPLYWQRNLIKVPAVTEVALSSNETSDLEMSEGKFDEAILFEPGIQKAYIDHNPKDYHYWFPLSSPTALSFNLTEAPFNNVKFRQAMDYAINKEMIYKQGEYGYEPPANESLLPPELNKGWLDQSLAKKYAYAYSPSKAQALLASIGYHKKNGQLIGPNGKQLSFTLECPTGWTDYIQDMSIIQKELGTLGIKVITETPSVATDYNDVETGHYQAALVYGWTESNPYYVYDYIMSSAESAPVGQATTFNANSERFNNPTANKLIAALAATTNVAKEHQIVDQLEQISFSQVPIVGLVSGAAWNEYQTNHYVGWPTASNPYADPQLSTINALMVITHLRPVS